MSNNNIQAQIVLRNFRGIIYPDTVVFIPRSNAVNYVIDGVTYFLPGELVQSIIDLSTNPEPNEFIQTKLLPDEELEGLTDLVDSFESSTCWRCGSPRSTFEVCSECGEDE